jgi:hypothetical protein
VVVKGKRQLTRSARRLTRPKRPHDSTRAVFGILPNTNPGGKIKRVLIWDAVTSSWFDSVVKMIIFADASKKRRQ